MKDLELPGNSLITIVRRRGKVVIPHGDTVLKKEDELFIIGEKADIDLIRNTYCDDT